MAKKTFSPKLLITAVLLLVAGLAGLGYFNQVSKLGETSKTEEGSAIDQQLLAPKPTDIILGDSNAIVTIVEYSSLSCPHCAHFHNDVLPDLKKEFIDTGKVKLVYRHFPFNGPAVQAAQLVECAGKNDLNRENFLKVLFSMQQQWAFAENFRESLAQIAKVGGMDSAIVESCLNDKDAETALLANQQEAATKLSVNATPTFFINGIKYEGAPDIEGFREAIANAGGGE